MYPNEANLIPSIKYMKISAFFFKSIKFNTSNLDLHSVVYMGNFTEERLQFAEFLMVPIQCVNWYNLFLRPTIPFFHEGKFHA